MHADTAEPASPRPSLPWNPIRRTPTNAPHLLEHQLLLQLRNALAQVAPLRARAAQLRAQPPLLLLRWWVVQQACLSGLLLGSRPPTFHRHTLPLSPPTHLRRVQRLPRPKLLLGQGCQLALQRLAAPRLLAAKPLQLLHLLAAGGWTGGCGLAWW